MASRFAPAMNAAITPSQPQGHGGYAYEYPRVTPTKMTKTDKWLMFLDAANQLGLTESLGSLLGWFVTTPKKESQKHFKETFPKIFNAVQKNKEIKKEQKQNEKQDPNNTFGITLNIPGETPPTGGLRTPYTPIGAPEQGTGSTQAKGPGGTPGLRPGSGTPPGLQKFIDKATNLLGRKGAKNMQGQIQARLGVNPEGVPDDLEQAFEHAVEVTNTKENFLEKAKDKFGQLGQGLGKFGMRVDEGFEDAFLKFKRGSSNKKMWKKYLKKAKEDHPHSQVGGPKDLWEKSVQDMAMRRYFNSDEYQKQQQIYRTEDLQLDSDRQKKRMTKKEHSENLELDRIMTKAYSAAGIEIQDADVNWGLEALKGQDKNKIDNLIQQRIRFVKWDVENTAKHEVNQNDYQQIITDGKSADVTGYQDITDIVKIIQQSNLSGQGNQLGGKNKSSFNYGGNTLELNPQAEDYTPNKY